MRPRLTIAERLQKYTVATGTGCWEFRGYQNQHGYGRLIISEPGKRNRLLAVHRLAYEAWVGPIPDGLDVLHACDNRSCINPSHLWLGDQGDNMRDMVAKGRWRDGWPTRRRLQYAEAAE